MVFLVRSTLTEEDRNACRQMAVLRERAARKKRRRAVQSWLGDKLCGIGDIVFGALILYAAASGGMRAGWAIPALLFTAGGACILIKAGRCPAEEPVPLPGQNFSPAGMPGTPIRAVFFGDGYFVFWNASEKVRLGYSSITAVWEDGERFYFFFQAYPPLVLPKRDFRGWTPEDFRSFLEGELGWPVEVVK